MSKAGASTHTGGVISVHTIIRNKEVATGEKMDTREVYMVTFLRVEDRGKLIEDLPQDDERVQFRAQGGPNSKGQVTGLNHLLPKTVVAAFIAGSSVHSPYPLESQSESDMKEVKTEIAHLKDILQHFVMLVQGQSKGKHSHEQTIDDEDEEEGDDHI